MHGCFLSLGFPPRDKDVASTRMMLMVAVGSCCTLAFVPSFEYTVLPLISQHAVFKMEIFRFAEIDVLFRSLHASCF